MTTIKQIHGAVVNMECVVHPDKPEESLILANKHINFTSTQLAPMVEASQSLRTFQRTYDKVHMEEEKRRELMSVLEMEPVIPRKFLGAHAALLMSAPRGYSDDWGTDFMQQT